MKFKTKVKYNGVYYAAGEDVPMEELGSPEVPTAPEQPSADNPEIPEVPIAQEKPEQETKTEDVSEAPVVEQKAKPAKAKK